MTTAAPAFARGSLPAISDADAISLLYQLVAIRSHSGNESTLAACLVMEMANLGLESRIDGAGNAIGATRAQGPTADIVLLGHMDTVPGDIPVYIENGVLHGRGSVDAKGPLAAFIIAAATARLPRGVRVVVVGAVEEESATSRGARFASRCFSPRACIIGEPSSFDAVTLGYKGRLLAEYTLRLPCGHTAGPHVGVAEHAVSWWQAVRASVDELNAERTAAFDSIQAGLRSINTTSDGLHDRVRAVVGFRLPPNIAPESIEAICTDPCHRLGRLSGLVGAGEPLATNSAPDHPQPTITFSGHEHAFVADRHNPLVRAFTTAIRAEGASPRLLVKTGTSDMNVVGPEWACPIVAYGPGDSTLDHTPGERINLDEYLRSIRILRAVLERLGTEIAKHTMEEATDGSRT